MKGINLFCSSSASTAVTSSIDHRSSMVRRSTKRYPNVRRKSKLFRVPCSSQLPINPKSYFEKYSYYRKSSPENQNSDVRRKSNIQVNNLLSNSNGSSTRYLLSDWASDQSDEITAMTPAQSADKLTQDQVVVLRVSLHCKACEGKVRKHISKMEGVTSFSIDMELKKVTITGRVTPSGVLASVSKVKKNAQLWTSLSSSSLS